MPNDSTALLDFTGIRYYDGHIQAWASGAFATKEELEAVRAQAARAYHFCGSVPSVSELPVSAHEGDVYNIGASLDGDNYVWAVWPANPDADPPVSAGSGWDKLGATVDLSQYLTYDQLATLVTPGVMSPEDKSKLDSIEPGAKNTTVDSALSDSSTNPVRNSVLTSALNLKLDKTQVAVPSVSGSGGSNGAMTAADKEKLDGIAAGANLYVLPNAGPSTLGGVIVDTAVDTTVSSGGTIPDAEVQYHVVQNRAVHASLALKIGREDYAVAPSGSASGSAGTITASDYAKLQSIASGANAYVLPHATPAELGGVIVDTAVDTTVSSGGTIPDAEVQYHVVQNQAVHASLALKIGREDYAVAPSGSDSGSAGTITASDYAKLQSVESSANHFVLEHATPILLGGVIVDAAVDTTVSSSGTIPDAEAQYHVVQNAAVYDSLTSKVARTDYATARYESGGVVIDEGPFSGGSWVGVSDGTITASDYAKLQSIESGANRTLVDSVIDSASTRPVENQAVYSEIQNAKAGVLGELSNYVSLGGDQSIGGTKTFLNPIVGSVTGNAGTAGALATARTISLDGQASGAGSFDGSSNTVISVSIPNYVGATSETAGVPGLVPPATAAQTGKVLLGDGTWGDIPDSGYVHLSNVSAAETIYGTKVFMESPQVPTPRLGTVSGSVIDYGTAHIVGGVAYVVANGQALPSPATSGDFCFSGKDASGYMFDLKRYNGSAWSAYTVQSMAGSAHGYAKSWLVAPYVEGAVASSWDRWTYVSAGDADGGFRMVPDGDPVNDVCVAVTRVSSASIGASLRLDSCWKTDGNAYAPFSTPGAGNIAFVHARVMSGGSTILAGDYTLVGIGASASSDWGMQAVNVNYVSRAMIRSGGAAAIERGMVFRGGGAVHVLKSMPKFTLEAVGIGSGPEVHPAFTVRAGGSAVNVLELNVGSFEASFKGDVFQTVSGAAPAVAVNRDVVESGVAQLNAAIGESAGAFQPLTAAAWAARALWLYAQNGSGAVYTGNTDYGQSHAKRWQTGMLGTSANPGDSANADARTQTGNSVWSDDGSIDGLFDLTGNVREYVAGMKLSDGALMLQDPVDGEWKYVDATSGVLAANPDSKVMLAVNSAGTSFTWGTGAGAAGVSAASQPFDGVTCTASGAENLLKAYALLPVSANAGMQGTFEVDGDITSGEFYAYRGGCFMDGSNAGPFAILWHSGEFDDNTAGARLMYLP